MQDLRYACRMLLKAPAVSALSIVTLAIGIGTTSAIFSLVNAALLKPLPGIGDPERVVTIGRVVDGDGFDNSSYLNYLDLRDQNTVFSDVAAVKRSPFDLATGTSAVRLTGAVVTPNYFRTMGAGFARGGPLPEDGQSEAVISYAVWTQHFGRDDHIIGKGVTIDGQSFQIAGVTAAGFRGADATGPQDLWLPLSALRAGTILPAFQRDVDWFNHRGGVWLMLYGRLKAGVNIDQARAEVSAIAQRLRAYPENEKNGWRVVEGVGLDPEGRGQVLRLAGLLLAAVGLLFTLACANVATLTLARVAARAREVAVRLALGASRGRIARQLLTESLLLALLGGAGGLLVAAWAAAGMSYLFSGSSRFALSVDLYPDLRVLGFTFVVSCLAGTLVGAAPALQSARVLLPTLKQTAGGARQKSYARRALVVVQLALSTILLVGAGLLLQSVRAFNGIEPGFDPQRLVLLTVEPSHSGKYGDEARLRLLYRQMIEQVRAIRGVDGVTIARVAPVTPRGFGTRARIVGKPGSTAESNGLQFNTVAPGYFDFMRIPILRGRAFTPEDSATSPPVTVINQIAADRFWPGEDPLGKQVWVNGEPAPRQVVGVAALVKYRNLVERPYPLAYYSLAQPFPMPDAQAVLHVRSGLSPAALLPEIEREIRALDPDLPVFDVKSVSRHMADSYWQQRLVGIVIGVLAVLALALGSVGMYGVMAYAVADRTREMGIRMALGATTSNIARLFTLDAARLVGIGALVGVVLARAGVRIMGTLLFGVAPGDPVTYGAAVAVLTLVAFIACAAPVRRATAADPMTAVRTE